MTDFSPEFFKIKLDPEYARAACGCSFTARGFVLEKCAEAERLTLASSSTPYGFRHLDHYEQARTSIGMAAKPKW